MQMNEDGLALIRRFEGFRAEAYRCPAGVWTIGYGHTSDAGPPAVRPGLAVSEEEGARILAADVERFANGVGALLAREVTAAQFSALVSFAFNVGLAGFRRSSVLKAVNEGRFEDVPAALKLWVKGAGRVLPGLERRRAAEAELFMSDAMPRAGRAEVGVPTSVEPERRVREAGGLAGLLVVIAGAAGILPAWLLLSILLVALAGIAAWVQFSRHAPAVAEGV